MIDVRMNQRELTTESKSTKDSIMRFWFDSSSSTWSYSERATQKMIDVTFSKQWIHFFRSERWPPTSNMLYIAKSISDFVQIKRLAALWSRLLTPTVLIIDPSWSEFRISLSSSSALVKRLLLWVCSVVTISVWPRRRNCRSDQLEVLWLERAWNALWSWIHQVKFALVLHDIRNARISPYADHALTHLGI